MQLIYKYSKLFFTSFVILISFFISCYSATPLHPLKIAILQIIEHPALNSTRQGIYDELNAHGYREDEMLTWFYHNAQGKSVLASQIAHRLVSERPDAIIAIGTPAAQAVKQATRGTDIPVIFTATTDPLGAHLVKDLKKPDENVTGVSDATEMPPQIAFFKAILKDKFRRLGVIYNTGEANSVTNVEKIRLAAKEMGIPVYEKITTKTSDVAAAAQSLIGRVDAIFICDDNTALAAFLSLIKVTHQHKVPVFTRDAETIEQGALAVLGPSQYELGRQTARLLLKVMKNKKLLPPVEFPEHMGLLINQDLAKAWQIQIPKELLDKATNQRE